jgi:uncharacterized membrane protein YfcA
MTYDLASNIVMTGATFLIATFIGITGIGGLLLAPSLNAFANVPIHEAIPACMFGFLFAGLVATLMFSKGRAIQYKDLFFLALGAGPAALIGSFVLPFIPSAGVILMLATLCILSGFHTLLNRSSANVKPCSLLPRHFVAIGLLTGFGSAITGTGGPLILLPILMLLQTDLRQAVGLAQGVQIPIGILATSGNMYLGKVNFDLAIPLTIVLVIGVILGVKISYKLPLKLMRNGMAVVMVSIGLLYLINMVAI